MNVDPLDGRQLRAFSSLARTGSFTQTARELHLTQSAVSHAIRALEEEVGCRLLDRSGKKATLTQSGEQLLRRAERILTEMELAREELKQLGKWGSSRLRLAAAVSICQHLLPPVLLELRERFPNCAISLEPCDTPEALALLREQKVELALALEPRGAADIHFRPIFADDLQFVLGPAHPWANARRVVEPEIPRQKFILYDKSSYTVRLIQEHFRRRDLELHTMMELGDFEAIKALVKLDLGVAIMAPWVARKEIAEGSLVALPLGRQKLRRRWGILHRRSRRLALPEEAFVRSCRSVADLFRKQ